MPPVSRPGLRVIVTPQGSEDLYQQYSAYVAALAYRILGRDAEVEDVVQDVFLAAVTGLHRLRDPGALKGWLASATVNVASRRLRRRKVLAVFGLDAPTDEEVSAPGASPEEKVLLSQVYFALDALPVKDRVAWVLRNVEGESLDRVAELCDCSLATAKRRISAAQEALGKATR
jgi:RNA polymerase sigma-70 factor, ECF subfamily